MFLLIDSRRFTGSTHGNNSVSTFGNMKLDERFQAILVDRTVFAHGRHQRHHTAVKHEPLRTTKQLRMVRFRPAGDKTAHPTN